MAAIAATVTNYSHVSQPGRCNVCWALSAYLALQPDSCRDGLQRPRAQGDASMDAQPGERAAQLGLAGRRQHAPRVQYVLQHAQAEASCTQLASVELSVCSHLGLHVLPFTYTMDGKCGCVHAGSTCRGKRQEGTCMLCCCHGLEPQHELR